jgi:hypothetical protein
LRVLLGVVVRVLVATSIREAETIKGRAMLAGIRTHALCGGMGATGVPGCEKRRSIYGAW